MLCAYETLHQLDGTPLIFICCNFVVAAITWRMLDIFTLLITKPLLLIVHNLFFNDYMPTRYFE